MAVGLQQLRYFLAVVEEGQITAAARRLYLAQPALSQAMGALERDLGVTLLVRHRRGVTPTPAGAVFAEKARVAVHAVDDAIAAVRREGAAQLVFGVQPGVPLDALLGGFRATCPEVPVRFHMVTFVTELSAVRDGDVDVGFVFPRYAEPTVSYVPLARIPPGVYCGWETALARERTLRFEQIAEETHPGQHASVPDEFVDLFNLTELRGHRPKMVEAPTTMLETFDLFLSGRAISVAPAGVRHPAPSPVATVPLVDVAPFEVSLVYRTANASPALDAFLRYVDTFEGQAWAHELTP